MATSAEIAVVLSKFRALFANYNPADITATAEVWREALGHIPGDELKAAALACSVEPGRAFAPSAGEVIGAVMRMRAQAQGLPSAAEAWEQVNQRYIYNKNECYQANRLFEKANSSDTLDAYFAHTKACPFCNSGEKYPDIHPAVRRVATQFGWPDRFPGDNPEADRAHFMRAYEAEIKTVTEREAQPEVVKRYIEATTTRAIAALADGMRAR